MKTDPILELMALSISGFTTLEEALDALQEAYRMGLEDGRKRALRTSATVDQIKRKALHG